MLSAEVGGVSLALQLATGVPARVWAVPVALVTWLLLWRGTFEIIEHGVAALGLVTLCFVVAVLRLHPDWSQVAGGLIPRLPDHDRANYLFIAVSILGATISPYLISFYSSGAVEEKWEPKDLGANRITAGIGMGFGSAIGMSVLMLAALVLAPRGILVQQYDQTGAVLAPVFPRWGFALFVASLAIGCFGAALELSLDSAYIAAQALGWSWGEDQKPAKDSRFCLVYTVMLALAALPTLLGAEPLRLTLVSMALTVLILPLAVAPLLVLMNDERYLERHRNGWIGNTAVLAILAIALVLAIVAIPLQILGGS